MRAIKDLMTRELVTVSLGTPITECAEHFARHRIRHLPVVEEGALVGMVTDFEVMQRGWMMGGAWVAHDHEDSWLLARHVSREAQVVVGEDELTVHTLRKLLRSFQDAAIVVNADNAPVGIVTEHDAVRLGADILGPDHRIQLAVDSRLHTIYRTELAREARSRMTHNRIRHVVVLENDDIVFGVLSFRDVALEEVLDGAICDDLVSRPAVCLRVGASLAEAAQTMATAKIGCLPIVDDTNKAVGIVTRSDVIRVTAEILDAT